MSTPFQIFKASALPASLIPNSIYLVPSTNTELFDLYVVSNDGQTVKRTIVTSDVESIIDNKSKGYTLACSDEISALTVTPAAIKFRPTVSFTLVNVLASLSQPSTSGNVTVDIKLNGVSILSTLLTIDVGETTSVSSTTPVVI